MSYLLILGLILLYTMQSFFCKRYTDSYPGDPDAASPVFSVFSGVVTALVTLIFALFTMQFHFSWQVCLLGVLNGAVLAGYNFSMIQAARRGPYSVQMVFMLSGGILLPAFVAFIYGDRLAVSQWLSVALILISIVMVSKKPGEKFSSGNVLFWVFCLGLFAFNGAYGTLFDIQQNRLAATAQAKNEMIMITFGTSAVLNALMGLIRHCKQAATLSCGKTADETAAAGSNKCCCAEETPSTPFGRFIADFKQTKRSFLYLLLCALVTAGAINLLVFIMPLINITVLYTFDNAGVLLFSVLCSFFFLKEKLSAMNLVGCALMAIGLIGMVAAPF